MKDQSELVYIGYFNTLYRKGSGLYDTAEQIKILVYQVMSDDKTMLAINEWSGETIIIPDVPRPLQINDLVDELNEQIAELHRYENWVKKRDFVDEREKIPNQKGKDVGNSESVSGFIIIIGILCIITGIYVVIKGVIKILTTGVDLSFTNMIKC